MAVELKRIESVIKRTILNSVKNISDKAVKVGWINKATYADTNVTIAEAAATNEYGNPFKHIPARSFMRTTIVEQENVWRSQLEKDAINIIHGQMTIENSLERIGLIAAGDIRKKIAEIYEPPLSPVTIYNRLHRKNNKKTIGALDKPLVDTGVMLGALTSKVESV